MKTEIAIIGWWASWVWLWVIFEQYWIQNYKIFEMWKTVWNSFSNRTEEIEFISPSFVSEDFEIYDLNALSFEPEDSPWRFLKKERFSGKEYQTYLEYMSKKYNLKIENNAKIVKIEKKWDIFKIFTENWEEIEAKIVVYAGWEYHFPNIPNIEWKEYWIHNSSIKSYKDIKNEEIIVIGWYESWIDVSYNCLKNWQKVNLIMKETEISCDDFDPSVSISLYSQKRLAQMQQNPKFQIIKDFEVSKIEKIEKDNYKLISSKWQELTKKWDIIFTTGFDFSKSLAQDLFEFNDSRALINDKFESTKIEWLFLIWPMLKVEKMIFCFIYKYRLIFPVIAFHIMNKLWMDSAEIEADFHIFGKDDIAELSWNCC